MTSGHAERLSVADLRTYHRNPRRGNVPAIRSSLLVNGQYRPVVVNLGTATGRPNEVLAGNHTLLAHRQLASETPSTANPDPDRWAVLDAWVVDLDDDQAARVVTADNRTGDLGEYDDRLLAELLADLPNLDGTGYDPGDLDDLMAELEEGDDDPDDLGSNQRKTAGMAERKETYETGQGQRVIVLGYGSARYVWVVEALTGLLERYGVDTNADALVALLEDTTDTTAPPDETPDDAEEDE